VDGAPREPDALVRAVRGVARPERLGDFLLGLFAVSREPLRDDDALLGAIDRVLSELAPRAFQIALPSLRQAFGFFPPRERLDLARRLVTQTAAGDRVDPGALVAPVNVGVVEEGLRRDRAAREAVARYFLDEEPSS
jgi:hypothetical protein